MLVCSEGGVLLEEGVGDVLQEDQAEDDMLVLGGVHVAAQLLGGLPEAVFEAEVGGAGSRLGHGLFLFVRVVRGDRPDPFER